MPEILIHYAFETSDKSFSDFILIAILIVQIFKSVVVCLHYLVLPGFIV